MSFNNGHRFQGQPPIRGNGRLIYGRGTPSHLRPQNGRGDMSRGQPPPMRGFGRGQPIRVGPSLPPPPQMIQQRRFFRGRGPRHPLPPTQLRGRGVIPPPPPPPPPGNVSHMRSRQIHGLPAMGRGSRSSGPGRFSVPYPSARGGPSRLPPPPPPQTPHAILRQPPRTPILPPFARGPAPSQTPRDPTAPIHANQVNSVGPQKTFPSTHSPATIPTPTSRAPDTSGSIPKEQLDKAWITHTPSNPGGKTYYYNTVTKISTYEMPDAMLRKEREANPVLQQSQQQHPAVWREYTDAGTGKKYYSNGVSTSWEPPEEFKEALSSAEEPVQPPTKKKKKSIEYESKFGSKDEAFSCFRGLLLAKEVTPEMKWNDVSKLCGSDSRWNACEVALSIGERKQCLAEFQTKRANEIRILDRKEKARVRDSFLQLLRDRLPELSNGSVKTRTLAEVREHIAKDDRFYAVADEETRESLYVEFCEEEKKRQERKQRNKKREAKDLFIDFLKEMHEQGKLTFASTWSSFLSLLRDDEKGDTRFATSAILADSERQVHFADFVLELQAAQNDKRRRIHAAKENAERAQREAFVQGLRDLASDGKLYPSSQWQKVETVLLQQLPSYGPVREQESTTPRDLFEDFVRDWSTLYKKDRAFLAKLINREESSWDALKVDQLAFEKMLLKRASANGDIDIQHFYDMVNNSKPVSSVKLYLQELRGEYQGLVNGAYRRPSSSTQRKYHEKDEASSEDEGEIVE